MRTPEPDRRLQGILRGSGVEGSEAAGMRSSAWHFCALFPEQPPSVVRRRQRPAGLKCGGLSCRFEDSTAIPGMSH